MGQLFPSVASATDYFGEQPEKREVHTGVIGLFFPHHGWVFVPKRGEVIALWKQGKSVAQIEEMLNVTLTIPGGISELCHNILSGNFGVGKGLSAAGDALGPQDYRLPPGLKNIGGYVDLRGYACQLPPELKSRIKEGVCPAQ